LSVEQRHWDENFAIGGGCKYHGQTCEVQTWVVGCAFENLLGVENPSKNTLILHKTLAARWLEELFSSCAVESVFGSGRK
jgi:hypothetical protein